MLICHRLLPPEATNDWLQEHLLVPHGRGWSSPLPDGEVDAAVKVVGVSRWNNFYVAGIQQLKHETGMDGRRWVWPSSDGVCVWLQGCRRFHGPG